MQQIFDLSLRLRAWMLGEPAPRLNLTPHSRRQESVSPDIQLSALRVVLTASLILCGVVGSHSAVKAAQLGQYWVLAIVAVVQGLLIAAALQARSQNRRRGAALLLMAIYAAAVSITITTGSQPELSKLGYVLGYAAPLVAGLLLNWRLALLLMAANSLLFVLAMAGVQMPQLPPRSVRLPHASIYVHSALFLFFNLCLPLAVFRMVAGMGKTQKQLHASRELSEEVFQAASAPTVVCDAQGAVLRANQPFLALCGLSEEQQLRGQSLTHMLSAAAADPAQALQAGTRWRLQVNAGGPASRREVLLRSTHGIGRRMRAYGFEDVTALRRIEADLAASVQREVFATWHDPLTGLANRSRCIQCLDALPADPGAAALALLTLRVCNLRQLNARYGVTVGDQLLQGLVRELLQLLPAGSQAARVRGSVLAVLLPLAAADDAAMLAAVQQLRDSLPVRSLAEHQAVILDLSFGVVAVPAGQATQRVPGAELLRRSELALDLAQDPRWRDEFNGIGLFNAGTAQAVARSMDIEAALPQALGGNELHLLYQPQLSPQGFLLGFEALVRWHSPALGPVSPVEFIPVAEACGLVGGITDWVLEQACAQLAAWRRELGAPAQRLRMAVNLSAHDLERKDLFERVTSAVRRHRLAADVLELELTESALARQPEQAQLQLRRLHEAGFRLAIDDFGTGYSSLAKLVDLPVAVLKIDRSFLHQLPGDARRERVVRSIVSLAHSLKLEVVAEGIEQAAQTDFLRQLAVQGLQGYLFGRPERPAHWDQLIREGRWRAA